jgi:nickel-dependent lactate racemase
MNCCAWRSHPRSLERATKPLGVITTYPGQGGWADQPPLDGARNHQLPPARIGGNDVWINRELIACPLKIPTGFIEPHFFAGFSGGGKEIMPGMAGQTTVMRNHNTSNIGNPQASWGEMAGNPIFAGDLSTAHDQGCAFVKQTAMIPVDAPFDIVATTNSGYPLDLNVYQTVKGMSAAARVVKPGGAIIAVAEWWDGIPDHGLFKQLLQQGGSPQGGLDLIGRPGFLEQDQWQAQIQVLVQLKADVYIHSRGLGEAQIHAALLKPAVSLEDTLAELVSRYGPESRICILPEGPVTIPYCPAIENCQG